MVTGTSVGIYGSHMVVSASYQKSYASIAWQGYGQWDGLTLKKQFQTALEVSV
jgi:hypothetical protein